MGFAADKSVEVLESASARRPCIERSGRAGFPHRYFMTLAELCRRVAIELERARERRTSVRQNGVITGSSGCDFGVPAHTDAVVIASGQQRLARGRTQRRGVEAIVLKTPC